MDNERKRGPNSENLPSVDSANRARNRTVMLTPEMTGQMRARMGGDYDPNGPVMTPGRISGGVPTADGGWDEVARGNPPNRLQAPIEQMPPEEEEPDWTRPIDSAIVAEPNTLNGSGYARESEPHGMSWTPPAESTRGEITGAPKVVRHSPPASGSYSSSPHSDEGHYNQPPAFGGLSRSDENQHPAEGDYGRTDQAAQGSHSSGPLPEEVFWKTRTPLVGFLVTFDHDPLGSYTELRSGRLIVTSEREASGNCLMINDSSVSPMHAIMRVSGGPTIQILDQLSENGTRIRRAGSEEEELLSGEKSTLSSGDVVIFGERKFHVCLLNLTGV